MIVVLALLERGLPSAYLLVSITTGLSDTTVLVFLELYTLFAAKTI